MKPGGQAGEGRWRSAVVWFDSVAADSKTGGREDGIKSERNGVH